jgi:hypothetical protein
MSARPSLVTVAAAALGVTLLTEGSARASAPTLLVFLHAAVKQRALQSELSAALSGVSVTAVGRIPDFDRALSEGCDAVLTLPLVLAERGLNPTLRGLRQGSPEERYALLAADTPPDPKKVASVGALDLLGREGTTKFVHSLVESRPKVERVTKVEDLLPLLQMQRVDAILLPARLIADIKTASRLKLAAHELMKPVGLPAAAATGVGGAQVVAAVGKLPARVSKTLGVEEWR